MSLNQVDKETLKHLAALTRELRKNRGNWNPHTKQLKKHIMTKHNLPEDRILGYLSLQKVLYRQRQ